MKIVFLSIGILAAFDVKRFSHYNIRAGYFYAQYLGRFLIKPIHFSLIILPLIILPIVLREQDLKDIKDRRNCAHHNIATSSNSSTTGGFCSASQRSNFDCINSQLSEDVLVALAILTAISGLIDALQLTNADKVFRVTPKRFAASVSWRWTSYLLVSYSSVSSVVEGMRKQLGKNRQLKSRYKEIEKTLLIGQTEI